jgi:elongation factor G
MGELHLEIIHERLKSEFKVDADLGKLMVAYKETISESGTNRITFERKLADQKHSVVIELEVRPGTRAGKQPLVRKGSGKEIVEHLNTLSERHMKSITNGVESALRSGPKLGFPVNCSGP